jgi:hypothetical protein
MPKPKRDSSVQSQEISGRTEKQRGTNKDSESAKG